MTLTLPQLPVFTDNTGTLPIENHPKVAISACLHGEKVRYDGSAKSLQTTLTILANQLQLIPICPEVGAGLTVPRPPVQLVDNGSDLLAIGRDDPTLDVTSLLKNYRQQSLTQFDQTLCGYIVKSRSPSCGFNSTPVFSPQGEQLRVGSGLQSDYFHRQQPWLQVVDELQLTTDSDCNQYIWRCRWLWDVKHNGSIDNLAQLHQHYRPLILQMAASHQQCLGNALLSLNPQDYWQAFGTGLQSLADYCR